MADLEHVRVRYKGAETILFHNPHKDIYDEPVHPGDVVEMPAHEVAAWPDGKNASWELVKADAPAVRKAEKAADSAATQGGPA